MRKDLITALVLLIPIGFAAPPSAQAMCVDPGPPRLLEAKVVSCEDPRAQAKERQKETQKKFRGPLGGDAESLEAMLAARPARVVKLQVLRSQQLSQDPDAEEPVTREPWTAAKETEKEEKRFLVLGVPSCDTLEASSTQRFVEEFTCCDVMPPQDLPCLLGLPALVPAPESLATDKS
jgi:hypothetical protein